MPCSRFLRRKCVFNAIRENKILAKISELIFYSLYIMTAL